MQCLTHISQCIFPVIEGLLPKPHNSRLLDVVFELQQWHGFAKLRLHTDKTLKVFKEATTSLGAALRNFQSTTCEDYITYELPSEEAARGRRKAAMAKKGKGGGAKNMKGKEKGKEKDPLPRGPNRKYLNLETYKYHCLPDYPSSIPIFGTSDNYNQQLVRFSSRSHYNYLSCTQSELVHHYIKMVYFRVNKNNHTWGLAVQESRERHLHKIAQLEAEMKALAERSKSQKSHLKSKNAKKPRRLGAPRSSALGYAIDDPLSYSSPSQHHHISESEGSYHDLIKYATSDPDDMAFEVRPHFGSILSYLTFRIPGLYP